jgi:hypothetical protein
VKPLTKKETDAATGWKEAITKLEKEIASKEVALKEAEGVAERLAEALAEKERAAVEKAELACGMSESGLLHLVELVCKYGPKSENSSDTSDSIWSHIHADFTKLVMNGDLVATDERGVKALRDKCACGRSNP